MKVIVRIEADLTNTIEFDDLVRDFAIAKTRRAKMIIGVGNLPWAMFLFRLFLNYLLHKFEKIKITV